MGCENVEDGKMFRLTAGGRNKLRSTELQTYFVLFATHMRGDQIDGYGEMNPGTSYLGGRKEWKERKDGRYMIHDT